MRGGFPAVLILLGLLNGSGPAGGLPLRKGWAADRRALVCGVVGLSGAGMRDTPAAALLGGGGCPRVPLVCGGGMLSGFWGSAPWLPDPSGLLVCCWGLWVGVGGLVVNCIVDASILL